MLGGSEAEGAPRRVEQVAWWCLKKTAGEHAMAVVRPLEGRLGEDGRQPKRATRLGLPWDSRVWSLAERSMVVREGASLATCPERPLDAVLPKTSANQTDSGYLRRWSGQ